MIGNKVSLDTNIISALLKGDAQIANKIDESDEVYISAIVIGELQYGAQYSTQVKKNTADINKLATRYTILNTDLETAVIYGQIKAKLRKQGTPIPENDIWIAACAIQYGLELSTKDRHFKEVEGLSILSW